MTTHEAELQQLLIDALAAGLDVHWSGSSVYVARSSSGCVERFVHVRARRGRRGDDVWTGAGERVSVALAREILGLA